MGWQHSLLGGLRFETGGDWLTYDEMFEDIRFDTLGYALTRTDPLYGALNWISAQLGTGIYLVNFVCCLILSLGVVRLARTFRDPWLAVTEEEDEESLHVLRELVLLL